MHYGAEVVDALLPGKPLSSGNIESYPKPTQVVR